MISDYINLNSFLKLGYFIDYERNPYQLDYTLIDRNKFLEWSEYDLLQYGITAFREGIERNFEVNRHHVVPLSGGLDSRAILAGLLEFTSASNIYTYTFGTPDTFDYEIGNMVAKNIGTKHISFPLTQYSYQFNELLDIARRIDNQTVLFHHPPVWELDKHFRGFLFWSGYIGDVITGGHCDSHGSSSISQVKKHYLLKYAYVTSLNLLNCPEDALLARIDDPLLDNSLLSFDEQILYQERIRKLTAPHILIDGFHYKTPFINNRFMALMLSVEDRYRRNQTLYKKILLTAYPRLFSMATKNAFGLPLNAQPLFVLTNKAILKVKRICNKGMTVFKDRNINYLDFNNAIRERSDFKQIFYNNLMDLAQRKIVDWIPIETIWHSHQCNKGNFADALIALTSLEIHIKTTQI